MFKQRQMALKTLGADLFEITDVIKIEHIKWFP